MKGLAILAVALITVPALAGQIPDSEHIYVAGQSTIKVVPDTAQIELEIYQTDMDVAKAKADVDSRCAKVITLAQDMGIKKEDITAGQMAIDPDYDWESDKKKVYKGTNVRREVKLVLRDLSKYGDLIQKLAEVPITELDEVNMGSSRMNEFHDQALTKAIEDAKAKAVKIAGQFDSDVGQAYSISETELHYDASRFYHAAYSVGRREPVFEPGTIDISAQIYVVFKLRPKK